MKLFQKKTRNMSVLSKLGLTFVNYTPVIQRKQLLLVVENREFVIEEVLHVSELDVADRVLTSTGVVPLADLEELGWQERALCAQTDPEAFFPEKGGSTREAKKVCLSCEVRVECLEYALEQDERFGIWGGLSERERRRLKKRAVS